jgi:hypothetical protein
VYFFSSSGQFFSARVTFCFLLGLFFGAAAILGAGVALGAATGLLEEGKWRTNMVTRGSVVSFLKSTLSIGTSLDDLSDLVCCCAKSVHSFLSARTTFSSFIAPGPEGTSFVMDCKSH